MPSSHLQPHEAQGQAAWSRGTSQERAGALWPCYVGSVAALRRTADIAEQSAAHEAAAAFRVDVAFLRALAGDVQLYVVTWDRRFEPTLHADYVVVLYVAEAHVLRRLRGENS